MTFLDCVYAQEVRGQLEESVLPLHQAGPRDQNQVVRLHGKCLYQQSCLASPVTHIFYILFHE